MEVTTGGKLRWQIVKTGSSYASQSEIVLTFGVGDATAVDAVRVLWPSGTIDRVETPAVNQQLTIREGEGLVSAMPIRRGGR